MSKKLKAPVSGITLVIGGLYETVTPLVCYEKSTDLSDCYTNIGTSIPERTTILCTSTGYPKQFVLLPDNKKIFAFRVVDLKLISLPQTEPTS